MRHPIAVSMRSGILREKVKLKMALPGKSHGLLSMIEVAHADTRKDLTLCLKPWRNRLTG